MKYILAILMALALTGCFGNRGGEIQDFRITIKTPDVPAEQAEQPVVQQTAIVNPKPPETSEGDQTAVDKPVEAPEATSEEATVVIQEATTSPIILLEQPLEAAPEPIIEIPLPDHLGGGAIRTTGLPPGSEIEVEYGKVEQPDNAETSATLNREGASFSTGWSRQIREVMGSLNLIMIIGAIAILIGGLLIGVGFKYPALVPKKAGMFLAAGGLGLITIGWFFAEYPLIALALLLTVVAGVGFYLFQRFGIAQRAYDGNIKGIEEFKRKHPEYKGEMNDSLRANQDDKIQKFVRKSKDRIRGLN